MDVDADFAALGFDVMEEVQQEEDKLADATEDDIATQLQELSNAEGTDAPEAEAEAPVPAVEPEPAASKPAPKLARKGMAPLKAAPKPATKPLLPAAKPAAKQIKKVRPAPEAADDAEADDADPADADPADAPGAPAPAAAAKQKKALPAGTGLKKTAPPADLKPKKSTPAFVAKKAAPKAPKAADADGAGPSAAPAGPKRPMNAYMLFATSMRAEVKAAHPALSSQDLTRKLGEMYKELGEAEQAALAARVAEDKARYEREVEAAGGPAPKKPRAPKGPRVDSAYALFCKARRPDLQAANPKAGMPEISKLLADAWKEVDEEEKAVFVERNKELKAAAKEAAAAGGTAGGEAAAAKPKKRGAAGPAGGGRKRAKQGAQAEGAAAASGEEEEEEEGGAAELMSDGEDDVDRENVDWAAHPAVAILSKTKRGKYVVARRGLPLHEYGEVDVAAANLQRAGQAPQGGAPCPLTVAQVDEYESFVRAFRRDVHAATEGRELVLEALPPGSTLEGCAFLGEMRQGGGEMESVDKRADPGMTVPVLATSRLLQRVLGVLRGEADALRAQLQAAQAALKAAGVALPDDAAVEAARAEG